LSFEAMSSIKDLRLFRFRLGSNRYPLVIYSGFSHWKWWFSIVMLGW
jgi:hypothetical protein